MDSASSSCLEDSPSIFSRSATLAAGTNPSARRAHFCAPSPWQAARLDGYPLDHRLARCCRALAVVDDSLIVAIVNARGRDVLGLQAGAQSRVAPRE